MLEGPPFARELIPLVEHFQQCTFPRVFRNTKIPPRRVSFSTTPPRSVSPKIPSYASTAAAAKVEGSNNVLVAKADYLAEDIIPRNSQGQRVDLPITVPRAVLDSLRGRKWCNTHYLLGYCGFMESCSYEHETPLNENQKNGLRLIARQTPCVEGLDCDDLDCISGHKCPRKPCNYGAGCRFSREMHNVDSKAVKF